MDLLVIKGILLRQPRTVRLYYLQLVRGVGNFTTALYLQKWGNRPTMEWDYAQLFPH
jgi:hypothetical protein